MARKNGSQRLGISPTPIVGFFLHDELMRVRASGFNPIESLQTATINPARFLSLENDLGTVEKGKRRTREPQRLRTLFLEA
jgi:hypothetical protein